MVKSMTGFGAVVIDNEDYSLQIELKSLNAKHLDVFIKLPTVFSEKEIEIRNLIGKILERGKISLFLNFFNKKNPDDRVIVNRPLVVQYYQDLKAIAELVGAAQDDLLRLAMMMPQAYIPAPISVAQDVIWTDIQTQLHKVLEQCEEFRLREGKELYQMFINCIQKIEDYLQKIEEQDPERVQHIRQRMHQQVAELKQDEQFDANRFEQELIYYIEKLDINEEKIRLKSHLKYFTDVLNEPISNGKKLNFIAQEIGREINTIGSKANDAAIQHWVVGMKEELEKIKEQLNNII
jgi:uncharacterized protein (TIGR00255 family)